MVQGAGIAVAANAPAEGACAAFVLAFEQSEHIVEPDLGGVARERGAAPGTARADHEPRLRQKGEDLGDEWAWQTARVGDVCCREPRLTAVVDFGQATHRRDGALGLSPIHLANPPIGCAACRGGGTP